MNEQQASEIIIAQWRKYAIKKNSKLVMESDMEYDMEYDMRYDTLNQPVYRSLSIMQPPVEPSINTDPIELEKPVLIKQHTIGDKTSISEFLGTKF